MSHFVDRYVPNFMPYILSDDLAEVSVPHFIFKGHLILRFILPHFAGEILDFVKWLIIVDGSCGHAFDKISDPMLSPTRQTLFKFYQFTQYKSIGNSALK